jgi:hypothetical protein
MLLAITTLPRYGLLFLRRRLAQPSSTSSLLSRCLESIEVAVEINLAIFYLRGSYYELGKRLMGMKVVSVDGF